MDSTVLVSAIAVVVSIIMGIVTLIVSTRVSKNIAREYGDLAGSQAAIDHANRKEAEARITALRALRNEVVRIRKLVEINSQIQDSGLGMVRMPTAAFETAFVSGPSGLSVEPELLNAAADYLVCADAINLRIDIYLEFCAALGQSQFARGIVDDAARQVREESKVIPEILNRVDTLLEHELEVSCVCSAAAA